MLIVHLISLETMFFEKTIEKVDLQYEKLLNLYGDYIEM